MGKKYVVICQKWEESERGWGVRPDGYSLHLTLGDCKSYIKAYWKKMPDAVPDEYSRPSGDPYECEIDNKIYLQIKKKGSYRAYSNDYPGSGGNNGWMKMKKPSN